MIFLIDHNLNGHALIFYRLLNDSDYRERCVENLIEIVLNINGYMGVSRLFIP